MTQLNSSKKSKLLRNKPLSTPAPISVSNLKSPKLVSETLIECIRIGDTESFREALTTHIMNSNKLQLAKKTGLGRQTLYDIMDPNKPFNPELSTLTAIIKGLG